MGEKDLVEKEFEAYSDVAADIINSLLYQGEAVVAEDTLISSPTETVYQGAERLRNQFQDLVKSEVLEGMTNAVYLFANQSDSDRWILLRTAGYTGAVYREQYDGRIRQRCPVIELVLYWGEKPWRGAKDMRQLFRGKKLSPKAWDYIDDLKLHVWEMRRLPAEVRELFQSDMRIVVDFLAEGNTYYNVPISVDTIRERDLQVG